jgi:trk system potassium uptake protein TrkA
MKGSFAVIGLGRFGSTVAITLANKGAEVLAIDSDEELVESMRDDVAYAVAMDATDIKAMKAQNIQDMDAVIVAIGSDFESLILITVSLMELKVKRIIARAMNKTQRIILEKLGVSEIVSPEVEVGISVAEKLLNPSMLTFMQLPDQYEIVEIQAPANIVGKRLDDLDLRRRYKINLITIKRLQPVTDKKGNKILDYHIIGVPQSETIVQEKDTLLLMGIDRDITKFIETNQ